MTEKITHTQIMSEIKHTNEAIDKIEKHLKELNGTVTTSRIAIACIKTSAATVSAFISIIITLVIAFFKDKI
jgi:hypothetical protein